MKLPERCDKWALPDNNIMLVLHLSAGSTGYRGLYPRKAVAADIQQDVFLHKKNGKKYPRSEIKRIGISGKFQETG